MSLKPIAYLGTPYSDPDPAIRKFRERAVTQMAFDLLKQNIHVYSPITHNMPIDRLGIFGDYQTWLDFDHGMLSRCNKLLVLKLPGWETSKGLAAEIAFAKIIGLPIEEIEPEPHFLNKISAADRVMDRVTHLLNNINLFVEERDWDQFHNPKNLAMSLQIESAEVAEHFLWLTEAQSHQLTPIQKQNVADELGDVYLNLLLLSEKIGVDLIAACLKKIEKIKQKYPIAVSKGNAIKYTELQRS
ncbi:MAG TPA: DUF1937 family protein [Gammaproteobacteria bacterium]|nr:DUF1937 family protein [Gammaproteobacteria bacterium]